MASIEKNIEEGMEFNQEKEPFGQTLKFYYDEEDEKITAITYDTKQGEVEIFPVTINLPDTDEPYNYIPNITVTNPQDARSDEDEKGPYFYHNFTDMDYKLENYLESDSCDSDFLHFLMQNLSEDDYMRFVIEQIAVKKQLRSHKWILLSEIYEEDKSRLVFQGSSYYRGEDGRWRDKLPIASEYESVYLLNKAIELCKRREVYNFLELAFNSSQKKSILGLFDKTFDEFMLFDGEVDLMSKDVKLGIELTDSHDLSDEEYKHLAKLLGTSHKSS